MPKCYPAGLSKLMESGLMPVQVEFFEEHSRRVVRQEKERDCRMVAPYSAMH
jgi:hypothetical protein